MLCADNTQGFVGWMVSALSSFLSYLNFTSFLFHNIENIQFFQDNI